MGWVGGMKILITYREEKKKPSTQNNFAGAREHFDRGMLIYRSDISTRFVLLVTRNSNGIIIRAFFFFNVLSVVVFISFPFFSVRVRMRVLGCHCGNFFFFFIYVYVPKYPAKISPGYLRGRIHRKELSRRNDSRGRRVVRSVPCTAAFVGYNIRPDPAAILSSARQPRCMAAIWGKNIEELNFLENLRNYIYEKFTRNFCWGL